MANNNTSVSLEKKSGVLAGKLSEQKFRDREAVRRKQNSLDTQDDLCKEVPDKKIRRFKEKGLPMKGNRQDITADVLMDNAFNAAAEKSSTEEIAFLNHVQNRAEQRKRELESKVPPLPDPDPTGNSYKLFVPRTDAYAHLSAVWGIWLTHFNTELSGRDRLYQDQLRERDPRLLEAVRAKLKNDARAGKPSPKLSEVLRPGSARTKAEIAELEPAIQKKLARLGRAAYVQNI